MRRKRNPNRKTETLLRQAACLDGKAPPRPPRTVTPGNYVGLHLDHQVRTMTYTPDDIQCRALKTWYSLTDPLHFDAMPVVLGIAGEAGEIADQHKKHLYKPGHEQTREQQLDELGDLLYYLAIRSYQLGITIDDLSILNRRKLENGRHGWQEVGQ